MAFPTILFNSTGSDTAASGAGPSTPLTGSGASMNSTTSIDLSADSPNLSGVAVDGSAVLYVSTTSGRKFFKITNTNNTTKVVTVANAATVTESGKAWAIGGKRATFDNATSRTLFTSGVGLLSGWTAEFEDDASAALSSGIALNMNGGTDGPVVIRGSAEGRVLANSANSAIFTSAGGGNPFDILFENLAFANTNGTKTSAHGFLASAGTWRFNRCRFGVSGSSLNFGFGQATGAAEVWLDDCDFAYCANGVAIGGNLHASGCRVFGLSGIGFEAGAVFLRDCVISGCAGGDGVRVTTANIRYCLIERCTIHGNGGDGIDLSAGHVMYPSIRSNNITGNANYGIRCHANQANNNRTIDYNNFGTGATANTSGASLNLNAGPNDLAVDPGYANAAGGNFAAGTSIKEKGFPSATRYIGGVAGTVGYYDIGIQRQEVGGSTVIIVEDD